MFLERETHVLLHLLQAVIVGVDEVKGQRASQRATPSAGRHTEEPANTETGTNTPENQRSDEQTDADEGKSSWKTIADSSATMLLKFPGSCTTAGTRLKDSKEKPK